jgi:hypothetical protein
MTDDEEFIAGFLEVFEKNPQIFVEQPGAVDALKNLSNTISDMTDKSNEEVAHAIGKWCEEYPAITNEINEINSIISRKLEPKPIKKEGQEPMLSNRYPSLPENLRNRLPKSQPPRE